MAQVPALPTVHPWLGLPLAEARRLAEQRGAGTLRVVDAPPPRPRRPFPDHDAWRVARASEDEHGVTLVVVPPMGLLGAIDPGPGLQGPPPPADA